MTPNFKIKEKFTKQKITENLGLKIASLIVAVVLWFVVVNVTDPIVAQTYKNVPVRVLNASTITNNNKTLDVLSDTSVISSVVIKAPRSVIQELGTTIDNVVATADMNKLSQDGTSVPIEITTSKHSDKVDSIRASIDTMYVNIEERKSIQLPLQATTSGEIESGFILGNVEPNQNQVRVSGPESVISTIKSAYVDVEVTGFTSDISTQSDIVLYDADGNAVDDSNLEMNVDSVRVDVEILATKKVPIYYSTSGLPAEGYAVTGEMECSPKTVTIAGSQSVIENTTYVGIPASELNITGQAGDMMVVLNIADFLPDGTRLGDASYNGKATITVYIEPLTDETYATYLRNVSIENVPEGFSAAVLDKDDSISFTLTGLAQDLEKLQVSELNFRVDFEDYILLKDSVEFEEGIYNLYLVMDLPEAVSCNDSIGIKVKLTKNEE